MSFKRWFSKGVFVLITSSVSAAANAGPLGFLLGDPNFSIAYGGMFRNETALKITSDENPAHQRGNPFNGVSVGRTGAPAGSPPILFDSVERAVPRADNSLNLQYLRGELKADASLFDNLRARIQVRAVGDPLVYDEFDPSDTPRGMPIGSLNQDTNLFEYRYDAGPALQQTRLNPTEPEDRNNDAYEARQLSKIMAEEGSSPLEFAGDQYMLDLPLLTLDYQKGPLLLRLGNQTIAWGDLLFFRILDVPNGLDLRRHLILDFVSEEFSDKRVPSLGIRASYALTFGWEVDAYAQRFRSTIFPNPNTPYTAIPAQFTVLDQFKAYDNEYNYGIRMRGRLGPVDLTLMANRRYNHFGVIQWTDTDVVRDLEPNNVAGYQAGDITSIIPITVAGTGGALADTVFTPDPTGVVSSKEFVEYAAMARLNHFTALNTAIREFPSSQEIGAQEVSTAEEMEWQEDFFLQGAGGLRGHVTRKYERENNFGLGLAYTIEGPDNSLLFNQINASIEAKYTPDRKFTPLDLNPYRDNLITEDELEVGVVLQKFVRHSRTFPAAFAVFQYLYRSESDIFNRHLSGFGADPDADEADNRLPDGIGSFNAIAFAFQQPFPNRIWRIDFAALYDVKGGLLVQPAVRWKPSGSWTFQIFANWIDTVHGNQYDNALSSVDYADEITTRIEYQF